MSIATRINSITNHLEKDYQALESVVGTVSVNKNIENIAPLLDNLWEDLPKVTGSGTSLSLATNPGKMKLSLKGNTSQTGTPTPDNPIPVNVVSGDNEVVVTGKNLLPNEAATATIQECTFTINEDKTISVNGTSTGWTGLTISTITLQAGTYTLSSGLTGTSAYNLYLETSGRIAKNTSYGDNTFTINEEMTLTIKLFARPNYAISNFVVLPMLNVGSTATTYEPYQSSTYPIHLGEYELCKIGTYQDKFIRNSGKNLFDKSKISSVNHGTNNNGLITSDYQNCVVFFDNDGISVKSGETIYFSCDIKLNGNSTGTFSNINDNTNGGTTKILNPTLSNTYQKYQTSFTYSSNTTINRLLIQIYNLSGTADINNIMISKQSNTTYEPYGNGDWYLGKNIGKVVLDDSKDWYVGDNRYSLKYFYTNQFTLDKINGGSVFSDNFKQVTTLWNFQTYTPCIVTEDNNKIMGIMLGDNTIQNVNDFKTWLSTHNTLLYYVLATPTYTKITGTLEEQLESVYNAYSYKGTTNINQVNNDLPFELDVSALKDLSGV